MLPLVKGERGRCTAQRSGPDGAARALPVRKPLPRRARRAAARRFRRAARARQRDDCHPVRHGENIGDHGLLRHNYSVWETLPDVPLIIGFSGGDGGGNRDDRLAQTVDLLPDGWSRPSVATPSVTAPPDAVCAMRPLARSRSPNTSRPCRASRSWDESTRTRTWTASIAAYVSCAPPMTKAHLGFQRRPSPVRPRGGPERDEQPRE